MSGAGRVCAFPVSPKSHEAPPPWRFPPWSRQAARQNFSSDKLIAAAEALGARGRSLHPNVSVFRRSPRRPQVNSLAESLTTSAAGGAPLEVYRRHCSSLNAERLKLLGQARTGILSWNARSRRSSARRFRDPGGRRRHEIQPFRAILAAEDSTLLNQLVAESFDVSSRTFVATLRECLPRSLPTRSSGGSISCSARSTTPSPARSGSDLLGGALWSWRSRRHAPPPRSVSRRRLRAPIPPPARRRPAGRARRRTRS